MNVVADVFSDLLCSICELLCLKLHEKYIKSKEL